jgi:hypothetical protein
MRNSSNQNSNQSIDIRSPITYDQYGKLIGQANSNLLRHQNLAPYTIQIHCMIQDEEIEHFAVIQYCNGYSAYLRSFFYKNGILLQNLHVSLYFACEFADIEDGTIYDFLGGYKFKAKKVGASHYCFYRLPVLDR